MPARGVRRATRRPPASAEVLQRDEGRRARHHHPARRRRRGRQVGDRPRLPAHARRARGARLLRAAQPRSSWPPASTPARAAALGQQSGDGTPIMLTIPTDRAVGAAADPRPRARRERRWSTPTCSSSPTSARRCSPAARASTSAAASRRRRRCSTTCARTRAWAGCPTRCGSPTYDVSTAGR